MFIDVNAFTTKQFIEVLFVFSGIGYQIVLGLASRGCKVIIADCITDEAIKHAIYKETHNQNIILKHVNLASFHSVREFAEDLKQSEEKLDILINNAGVGRTITHLSEDNINRTLQVNYYGGFLLTHLLLGKSSRELRGHYVLGLGLCLNWTCASSCNPKFGAVLMFFFIANYHSCLI